jgi:hypothetical protein
MTDLINISLTQPIRNITPIQTYQPLITECNIYYLEIIKTFLGIAFYLIMAIVILRFYKRSDIANLLTSLLMILTIFMASYILNSWLIGIIIIPLMMQLLLGLVEIIENNKEKKTN